MKKQLTKAELERELKAEKRLGMILMIILIVTALLLIMFVEKVTDLREERDNLASTLERLDQKWTTETHCTYDIKGVDFQTVGTAEFDDYEFYKEFMNYYNKNIPDNCEVLN